MKNDRELSSFLPPDGPSFDRWAGEAAATRYPATAISGTDNAGLIWIVAAFLGFFGGLILESIIAIAAGVLLLVVGLVVRSRARNAALRTLAPTDQREVRRSLANRRIVLGVVLIIGMIRVAIQVLRP